jgi:hypothetical protein
MYELDDLHCIDAPVEPAPPVELSEERRRPGRLQHVNPTLIPLLRNPAGDAIVEDTVQAQSMIKAALQRLIFPWAALEVWVWASSGVWISTIAAIWLLTGKVSCIGSAGGIILLFWVGWASRYGSFVIKYDLSAAVVSHTAGNAALADNRLYDAANSAAPNTNDNAHRLYLRAVS